MKKTLLGIFFIFSSSIVFSQVSKEDLYEACKAGNTIITEQYTAEGGDINIFFENGETALMTGCRENLPRIIKQVVNSGAELNLVNNDGMTAMTILRLQMGFNDTFASEAQTDLRDMYAFLKSKGGKEKDFVQLLADNYENRFTEEQKVVLQVKKDYNSYVTISESLKTLDHFIHERDEDESGTFTDDKNKYIAKYNDAGQLIFFRHKRDHHAEWYDNGQMTGTDAQYYFKNGKLYFYFETSYYGPYEHNYTQNRYYFKDDKIIVAAIKQYDEWWENMKEANKRFNFKNLVNIKDVDAYPKLDQKSVLILQEFKKTYESVKPLLK